MTVAPAVALPVKVRAAVILVTLSVADEPESDAAARSGRVGTATTDAVMLTVWLRPAEVFPAGSTGIAVKRREPVASAVAGVNVQLPAASAVVVPIVTPASLMVITDNGSAVPLNAGCWLAVGEIMVGNVNTVTAVSMVTTVAADATERLPARSSTVVVSEWAPTANAVPTTIDHAPEALATAVPRRVTPS